MISKNLGITAAAVAAMAAVGCGPAKSNTPTAVGYVNPSSTALNHASDFDPGFTKTSPNKPNSIEVTISGETLGENGLPFNPVNMGDPQFVDGWNVSFTHYIVVIGNIRLSPNALQYATQNTLNPSTCSDYDSSGCAVQRNGPYVIDVHNLVTEGANGFVGADGQEPAGGIFAWNAQDNGQPFDTSTLYAFSYNTVQAQFPATNVNLTDDEFAIYQTMVQNHWDKYIEGTATYVGTSDCPDPTTCDVVNPTTGKSIKQEFQAVDAVSPLTFKFGWDDHTSSLNCINPFNGDMDEANLANRGVQTNSSGAAIAQVTIHTDHVFWDELKHEGAPLRMDPLAAWAVGTPAGTELDLGTLGSKPIAPVTFADGTPIPDRGLAQNVPQMGYTATDQANPAQIELNLNGVPASNIAGLSNFMAFSAQSQTHLNANGLCYIEGQNAPDPWYMPNVVP
jgi:hypothetical protein